MSGSELYRTFSRRYGPVSTDSITSGSRKQDSGNGPRHSLSFAANALLHSSISSLDVASNERDLGAFAYRRRKYSPTDRLRSRVGGAVAAPPQARLYRTRSRCSMSPPPPMLFVGYSIPQRPAVHVAGPHISYNGAYNPLYWRSRR